jgi:hypothetical protein
MAEFNFTFVPELDITLLCGMCSKISEDPYQHDRCGQLYCRECLEEYGRHLPCLHCGRPDPYYGMDTRSMCKHGASEFLLLRAI